MALANVKYRILRTKSVLLASSTVWVGNVASLFTPWSTRAFASARLSAVNITARRLVMVLPGATFRKMSSLPAYALVDEVGNEQEFGKPGGTAVSFLKP